MLPYIVDRRHVFGRLGFLEAKSFQIVVLDLELFVLEVFLVLHEMNALLRFYLCLGAGLLFLRDFVVASLYQVLAYFCRILDPIGGDGVF